ncbi:hypothetical protein NW765_015445 [Fusarium oxysporum]|nr:hypothetical protein NW765_015445 [Fusarium oxysporum]
MLCAVCMSIFLKSDDRGVYHKDRENLTAAAENGCRICHYMNKQLQGRYSFPFEYELKWQDGRCVIWFYDSLRKLSLAGKGIWHPPWRVSADVNTVEQAPPGYDRFVTSVTADLEWDPCRVRPDFPSLRNISDNTGHEDVARLAKCWLQTCKQNDNFQDILGTRDSNWFPQRLIHVGDADLPPRLVLREEDHVQGGYAALSHCWGPNPQFMMLSSDTLEQFRDEIPLDELPASFRDAIITCRRLDIPYVWIDSLCILQRGQGSHSDWLNNSEEMHQVYYNCELNIALDASANPHEGAFRMRDPTVLQGCCVWSRFHPKPRVEYHGPAWKSSGVAVFWPDYPEEYPTKAELPADTMKLFEIYTPDDFAWAESDCPLNTRAWVFQERLLSLRTLHFSSDRITWECCQGHIITEYDPGGTALTAAGSSFYDAPFFNFSIRKDGNLFHYYSDLVMPYTERDLSHPDEDKLVAFAAVARKCISWFGGEYCAGIYRNTMPWGLLWETSWVRKKGNRSLLYRAPSWSWASVDHRITMDLIGNLRTTMAEVKDISIQLVDPKNTFGQVTSASLALTGPLVASEALVHKSAEEPESLREGPRWLVQWANVRTVAGHHLKLSIDGDVMNFRGRDAHQKWLLSEEGNFFLAIGEATTDPPTEKAKTYGLLLKRISDGKYIRVGLWVADYGFVSQHAETKGHFRIETVIMA